MGGRGSAYKTRMDKIGKEGFGGGGSNSGSPSKKLLNSAFNHAEGNKNSVAIAANYIETKIKGNNYETGVIIDKQGFVVAVYKGGKASVDFGADISKIKGNIVTHNHPSGTLIFSRADIRTTAKQGGAGVRVVVNSGRTLELRANNQHSDMMKVSAEYDKLFTNKNIGQNQLNTELSKIAKKHGCTLTEGKVK